MTQVDENMKNSIQEYARERLLLAMQQANANPGPLPETCEEYAADCNPTDKINEIRGIIDRPHGDDSPCEDPYGHPSTT